MQDELGYIGVVDGSEVSGLSVTDRGVVGIGVW